MIKRFLFALTILITCIADSYALADAPRISDRHKKIFRSYGIELELENYIRSDRGKVLTQEDLDADIEHIVHQFGQMGRKYVEMSKCQKIVIRGSHPKVAFARGRSLHFKYRTTGAIRHELFHAFDPFIFAYRYWKSLNNDEFFYVGGGRKGSFGGMSYREILSCFNNMSEFANDFTWSYAQTNHREDIASIFNHTTDPKAAPHWLARCRQSPVFRKKFFTLIANCAEATGYEYWLKLYPFTDEELNEIKNSYIDVAKERKLKIRYTKNNYRRYGWQRRTTMALMNLDSKMIAASGIKVIDFTPDRQQKANLSGSKLTLFDEDFIGMTEAIFLACCRKHPGLVKKYLKNNRSPKQWAELFRSCTYNVKSIARHSSNNTKLYKDILSLQGFTANWLPEKFWQDILLLRSAFVDDRQYDKKFARLGIDFSAALPEILTGEQCSTAEINNAKRIFIACSIALDDDFIRKTNVKKIAFAKKMRYRNKPVIGGIYIDDVLCLDPTFVHLGRTVFYELFLRFDSNTQADVSVWKNIHSTAADYVSHLARESIAKDRADTFAWLLWNTYHTFDLAKKSAGLRKKIDLILDMHLLTPQMEKILRQKSAAMQ